MATQILKYQKFSRFKKPFYFKNGNLNLELTKVKTYVKDNVHYVKGFENTILKAEQFKSFKDACGFDAIWFLDLDNLIRMNMNFIFKLYKNPAKQKSELLMIKMNIADFYKQHKKMGYLYTGVI